MAASQRFKKILLLVLLGLMFLPLLQHYSKLYNEKKLKGAYTEQPEPYLSLSAWNSGTFQDSFSDWVKNNAGFHATFVRVHNQLDYYMADKLNAYNVILGKDGYLYEQQYINAYLGRDYMGEDYWKKMCSRFKRAQDSLAAKNIYMLIALAPGKAAFFPEYLPDSCGKPSGKSNYLTFQKEMGIHGINHIDFMKWFLKMKSTAQYPLYPKGGIHWSTYGSTLALDSLTKFIRHKTNFKIPGIKITGINVTDSLFEYDTDINDATNLLWPIPPVKLAYPRLALDTSSGNRPYPLYTVADSYNWYFYRTDINKEIFQPCTFNYYNATIYSSAGITSAANDKYIMRPNSILMFLVTDGNLGGFPWKFLDDLEVLLKLRDAVTEEDIQNVIWEIKNNKDWLESVKQKAAERGISLDSMMRGDAVWTINKRLDDRIIK